MIISWFSCGIDSAVATTLALRQYDDVRIIYIANDSEHPDNFRFIEECRKFWNHDIEVFRSSKFKSQWEVIRAKRFINSPGGAPCTKILKKEVRWYIEDTCQWDGQVFGFDADEAKRAERFSEQNPKCKALFPLIKEGFTKAECMAIWAKTGIPQPAMYRLGFPNNNCIGCVKGGKGYWSRIRHYFPEAYQKMMDIEKELGVTCINGFALKELPSNYPMSNPIVPSCSLFCDPDFLTI